MYRKLRNMFAVRQHIDPFAYATKVAVKLKTNDRLISLTYTLFIPVLHDSIHARVKRVLEILL